MSLVAKLGAAIGVGNLTLSLSCDDEGYQGEALHGVANIKGGDVARRVDGLRVRLVHVWESSERELVGGAERSSVLHDQTVDFRCEVLRGSTHAVAFSLDIPSNARLPEQGEHHELEVEVQVESGVDTSSSARLVLWPARPVADTLRALLAATGWRLEGFTPRKARKGFSRAVLLPGEAHAKRFDRINLELSSEQEGLLQVYVTLDTKENLWKELTGGDEHDYSFSAPDAPAVVAELQALIEKHVPPS